MRKGLTLQNKASEAFREATPEEVIGATEKAKEAFLLWGNTPVKRRLEYIGRIKRIIIENADEIVDRIIQATGKVKVEALSSDILPTLEIISYYEKYSDDILKIEERPTPLIFANCYSYVEYKPMGVVAIFSPWNFPFQLSMVPMITALAAGNCALLKPSEVTPSVGDLIDEICKEAGLPQGVAQVVQGGKEIGQRLIEAKPDKIFFTGSAATGKKIMEAASNELIPIELELGGKDPMIVFEDADFERTVKGAVYGAFCNAGQVCVSVERVYAQRGIYEKFCEAVAAETRKLRLGDGFDADIGRIISPLQKKIIMEHIQEAVSMGAKPLTEIREEDDFIYPVVLKDAAHSMKVMTEETFGPVMPIMLFDTEEEAARLANDSIYGLNASVWSKDIEKAKRLASKLQTGSCAINDVVRNIGNPHLPFGGVKHSGMGRYHGPEGLRSFSHQTSVMVNRGLLPKEVNWFPYSENIYKATKAMFEMFYATDNPINRGKRIIKSFLKSK